jgi:alkanesulfonate monooxygenase SsuD/methylene tetrahydromethanopterin reductase-like flavin-dependent oxidoreductase (luciferase family)
VRRALRYGTGFFGAGSSTTAQFAGQVQVLRAALSEAQRDPATFPVAKRVYIAVEDDLSRAHERVDAALKEIYGSAGLDAVAVYGPPSACITGLREVAQAGADLIQLRPLYDDAEQMERLAAEVLDAVQHE